MKKILSGLLTFFIVFFLVEGLARIVSTIYQQVTAPEKVKDWYVYSPVLGWERNPGFHGLVFDTEREFDSSGLISLDTAQNLAVGHHKVIFLGDSVTFGTGVAAGDTFVEQLESLLPKTDAINLGVPGYTSYQGLQALSKYVVAMHPEIVVVSFNHNDRRYVLPDDEPDGEGRFQRIYDEHLKLIKRNRLEVLAENLFLFRSMRHLFRTLGPRKEDATKAKEVSLEALRPRVSPENYRKNLERIVELARSRAITTLFILFRDDPTWTEPLNKGIGLLAASQFDKAIENLRTVVDRKDPLEALARFYLARAFEQRGQAEEAREVAILRTPINWVHGGFCIYLDTEYNQIMREVARGHDIDIVDTSLILENNPCLYLDGIHLNARGHRKVAEVLAERIGEILSRRRGPEVEANN